MVGLSQVKCHQVHSAVKTATDLALVAQQLFLVHVFDVYLQEAFVVQELSTVGTFHIFSHFAFVQRQMMIQLFLCEKFLLFTSGTLEHLICMFEHVLSKQMLASEEIRTMLTKVALLQEVHVISAQVLFHILDTIKSEAAAIATDDALS